MTKKQREKVYAKYDGHCAYCGKEIKYKDMQVDHLIPQQRAKHNHAFNDAVYAEKNLMPACRRCNQYKRAHNLETFRKLLETLPDRLENLYIFKVALDYNLVTINSKKIKFYFENF